MRVGVYVGSFNPVHEQHMTIVKHIIENNIVDKVIVIPTLGYWDKQNLININVRCSKKRSTRRILPNNRRW